LQKKKVFKLSTAFCYIYFPRVSPFNHVTTLASASFFSTDSFY
jgi:hypothetical protein